MTFVRNKRKASNAMYPIYRRWLLHLGPVLPGPDWWRLGTAGGGQHQVQVILRPHSRQPEQSMILDLNRWHNLPPWPWKRVSGKPELKYFFLLNNIHNHKYLVKSQSHTIGPAPAALQTQKRGIFENLPRNVNADLCWLIKMKMCGLGLIIKLNARVAGPLCGAARWCAV